MLDRCRIRWGRVLGVAGDQVSVEYRPLTWDGRQLGYGPPEVETRSAPSTESGHFGAGRRGLGCAALGVDLRQDHRTQVQFLKAYTDRHMAIANTARQPAASLG